MKNHDFKKELIAKLKIENVDPAVQDDLIHKLEDTAHARLGNVLPELLSDEQLRKIEEMRKAKKSDDEVMDWIQSQVPKYEEVMKAMMLDIVDEINDMAGK